MYRTILACCVTAAVTAGVTSACSFATSGQHPSARAGAHQVMAPPATSVRFTGGVDLLCVNEPPSGAPQHLNQHGVACASDASPYVHVALWITRTRITLTKPAYTHTVFTVSRR